MPASINLINQWRKYVNCRKKSIRDSRDIHCVSSFKLR